MSCGNVLDEDPQLWCSSSVPSTHPAAQVLGGWGRHADLLLVHPHACISPSPAVPDGVGSQCSWNACAGVLGGCCTQSPSALAACVGSSWFLLSPCTNCHSTELWLAQGWRHGLCHAPVRASTVQHSFPSCGGLTWIHGGAGHQGKSHTRMWKFPHMHLSAKLPQGWAGLGHDVRFEEQGSTQCLKHREGCCIRPFCLAGVESPQGNPVKE